MTYRIRPSLASRVASPAPVAFPTKPLCRQLTAVTDQPFHPAPPRQNIIYAPIPTEGALVRAAILNAQRAETHPGEPAMPLVVEGSVARLRLDLDKSLASGLLNLLTRVDDEGQIKFAADSIKKCQYIYHPDCAGQPVRNNSQSGRASRQVERDFLSNAAAVATAFETMPVVSASSIGCQPVSVHIVDKGDAGVAAVNSAGKSVSAENLAWKLHKTFNLNGGVVELHSDYSADGDQNSMAESLCKELGDMGIAATVKGYHGERLPKSLFDVDGIRFRPNTEEDNYQFRLRMYELN